MNKLIDQNSTLHAPYNNEFTFNFTNFNKEKTINDVSIKMPSCRTITEKEVTEVYEYLKSIFYSDKTK